MLFMNAANEYQMNYEYTTEGQSDQQQAMTRLEKYMPPITAGQGPHWRSRQ